MLFKGSGVALVTPINKDRSVNFEELKKLIEFQIENKTDAIIICGTTGEPSTLTDDEQLKVIDFAVKTVNKRIPVIAGAGSNDTEHGVKLARESQKRGADGILVVTPYYNKTTQKGLVEHYAEYAKNVDIPIIVYNVPSRTGLNVEPKTAAELSKIENIIAIKEASSNLDHIVNLAECINGKMDLYSGNDNEIIPILSLGGIGVISVIANIVPLETHDVVMKYLNGDLKAALDLQLKLLPLCRAAFCEVNPIPTKTALKYLGYEGYHCRKPLTTMMPDKEEFLVSELKNYGLIK